MEYRFEILYANKLMKDVSNIMKKWDLGMDAIAVNSIMTFSTKKDIPISQLKELITEGYESCGCKVINIQGGKIE